MIEEGSPFPDFALPDQDGRIVRLADLKGRKAVIYFYPKDDTPGCTAEACSFRDRAPDFEAASLLGVSPDDAASHRRFADKFQLPFPLLADPKRELIEPLGLWVEKTMYGKRYMGVERTTFVLDEQGIVRKIFRNVNPQGHAEEVRAALA